MRKRNVKIALSALLCLCMVVSSVVVPVPAAAEGSEDTASVTVWEDFSRYEIGKRVKYASATEAEGLMETVESLGAIGGVNTLKLGYSSLRGYHIFDGDQGFRVNFDEPKSLKNTDYIMLYVKMPLSRADGEGNNWGKAGIAPMMYLGENTWVQLHERAPIYYLGVNSNEWKTVDSSGLYIDLPTGFEGYIKIPLDYYQTETMPKDIHEYSAEYMIFQFSAMGEQCGNAYINAIYSVSGFANDLTAKINGENVERYLTTGAPVQEAQAQGVLLEKAMKAEVLQDFSSYPIGYDLVSNGIASLENKKDVSMVLSESVGGFFKTPAIEISSKTLGGFHDTDPFYTVKYPAYTSIDDMKALLFYVKCAAPHPKKDDVSAIRFNLRTSKEGCEDVWTLLGKGSVKAMEKGTGTWKNYSSSGDGNGIVDLPANFEGYIMVELKDMLTDSIWGDTEGRYLVSSTFQFQATGGECGNSYIGAIYMITENEGKNDRIITFDGCNVFSLATDSYATESDMLNIGPKIGYSYDSFPLSTINQYPWSRNVTSDSAVLYWDEIQGASQYRVDVYSEDTRTDVMAYLCCNSLVTDQCELKLTNLKENTRYFFCVLALDETGAEVRVLNHQRFKTYISGAGTLVSANTVPVDGSKKR